MSYPLTLTLASGNGQLVLERCSHCQRDELG